MNSRHREIWGLKLVGYLFLAGLGSGAFGTAACLDLWTKGHTRLLTDIGAWISLLGVGLGALLLLWDLGVPYRAFRLLGNRSSLISAGTVILSTLLILSATTIVVSFISLSLPPFSYALLMCLAVIFSLATSIYVGFLLAVVKCRPFWNTPLLPLLFIASSISTGISAISLVKSVIGGPLLPARAADHMAKGEFVLLSIELIMVAFYVIIMENSLPQARTGAHRLVTGDMAFFFWIGVVILGLIMPMILMAVSAGMPSVSLSLMVLIGGFSLRYCVLSAGARALLPGEADESAFVR